MDIRPILSTLRRHKTAAALIVLQIALSCAIVCNALFLISTRIERIERDTGLVDDALIRINTAGIGNVDNAEAQRRADVAAVRAIPGVTNASFINHIPMDFSSWNTSLSSKPDQRTPEMNAAVYLGDEQLLETLGVRLSAGRDFLPEEYVVMDDPNAKIGVVLITRTVAEKLFPGQNPLGKMLYDVWARDPVKIVGVVDSLIRPNDNGGPGQEQYSIVLPIRPGGGVFAIRTTPERRAEVRKAAEAALRKSNPSLIILSNDDFATIKSNYYRQDTAMVWLLGAVCVALLLVTAFGIVGLASFWVQQRTKQIGVRRALGATRGQILRYFQTENFLLASLGIALGMLGAYGLNLLLMQEYELPQLPIWYLPVGAVVLWTLGQAAVFAPARRAAAVPPAVATRSV